MKLVDALVPVYLRVKGIEVLTEMRLTLWTVWENVPRNANAPKFSLLEIIVPANITELTLAHGAIWQKKLKKRWIRAAHLGIQLHYLYLVGDIRAGVSRSPIVVFVQLLELQFHIISISLTYLPPFPKSGFGRSNAKKRKTEKSRQLLIFPPTLFDSPGVSP